MKFNSTLKLSLLLLTISLGVGAASAWCGSKLGQEALKGVSQPEVNPTKKLTGDGETSNQPKEFVPMAEKVILTKVEDYIKQQDGREKSSASQKGKPKAQEKEQEEEKLDSSPEKNELSLEGKMNAKFPLKAEDGGITLEVVKATQQGNSLLLDVNLTNRGDKAIEFLYSFLEVKDDRGQSLSAIAENLPEELPANGETFSGTIRIPGATIDGERLLSLNLTDYPDQQLQLQIADIPTVQ